MGLPLAQAAAPPKRDGQACLRSLRHAAMMHVRGGLKFGLLQALSG